MMTGDRVHMSAFAATRTTTTTTRAKRKRLPDVWGCNDDDHNSSVDEEGLVDHEGHWAQFVESRSRMFRGSAFLSEDKFRAIVRKSIESARHAAVDDECSVDASAMPSGHGQAADADAGAIPKFEESLTEQDRKVVEQVTKAIEDDTFAEINAQLILANIFAEHSSSSKLQLLVDALDLVKWPEDALELCGMAVLVPETSRNACHGFVTHALLPLVKQLNTPASRVLINLVTRAAALHPSTVVSALFVPILSQPTEQLCSHHCEVVLRAVKDSSVPSQCVGEIMNSMLGKQGAGVEHGGASQGGTSIWCSDLILNTTTSLLSQRVVFPDSVIGALVSQLEESATSSNDSNTSASQHLEQETVAVSTTNSVKFANLVFTLATRYKTALALNGRADRLLVVMERSKAVMAKPAIMALKRAGAGSATR